MNTSIISTKANYSVLPSQHQLLNTLIFPPYGTFTTGTATSIYGNSIDTFAGYALGSLCALYGAGGTWNQYDAGYAFIGGGDAFNTGSVSARGGDGRLYGGIGFNAAGTGVGGNAVVTPGHQVTNGITGYTISNPGAGYPLDGTFMDVGQENYYYWVCSTTGKTATSIEITISGGQLTDTRFGGLGAATAYGAGSNIGDVFTLYVVDPDYPNTPPSTLAQITVTAIGSNAGGSVLIRDCFVNTVVFVNNDGSLELNTHGNVKIVLNSDLTVTHYGALARPAMSFNIDGSTTLSNGVAGYPQLQLNADGSTQILSGSTGATSLSFTPTNEISVGGSVGILGQVFTSQGVGTSPIWTTPNYNNPQTVALVAGTASVSDATVTGSTTVLVTVQTPGGTQGFLSVAITAGVGFVINSTNIAETSTVAYFRVG